MTLFTRNLKYMVLLSCLLASSNLVSKEIDNQVKSKFGSQLNASLDCVIQPYIITQVSSAVNGIIEKVYVDKSHIVEKGQKLARLESSVERATVALAKARAKQKENRLTKKINWDFFIEKQKRIEELFLNKAVTSHEKEEAIMNTEIARLEYEQSKALQGIAQLELNRAEAALRLRTIRSPISGVITEKYLSPGELVRNRPLFQLAQLDPLRVTVIVQAKMFGKITPGSEAEVRTNIDPYSPLKATVDIVAPVIDAASDTFDIVLSLPNPDHKLPGGLRCKIKFDALNHL